MSVQRIYPVVSSESHLRATLLLLNAGAWPLEPMPWRRLALSLPRLSDGKPINFATLSAYAHNKRPIVNKEHRKVLGLVPHGTKYQHITIRKDDPESAARSLVKLIEPEILAEVMMILEERMKESGE